MRGSDDASSMPDADDRPRLIIVAHGEGRGRYSPLLALLRERLSAANDPFLDQIVVHRTGEPEPRVRAQDAVFFWLSDPLDTLFPACFEDGCAIDAAARAAGARVLNAPHALCRTSKMRQNRIWAEAGVPCARSWAFPSHEALCEAADELSPPLIIRYDRAHSQQDMVIVRSADDIRNLTSALRYPVTALEFIDVRETYRRCRDNSVYGRYHHKKRAFVFGDRVVNTHVFFAQTPIVGMSSSTFTAQARWTGRYPRKLGFGRKLLEETVAADLAYFDGPPEQPEVLIGAVKALGLDIAAIDYATKADGELVLWEANAYPYISPGEKSVLATERDAVRRVDRTVDVFIATLKGSLADRPAFQSADLAPAAS